MNNSQMALIKSRIENLPTGRAFVIADFTDVADYENAKKCLLRLEKNNFIRRIIRGIYDKPYFSKLLNEYSSPDIEETAKAIARNYNWQISPSSSTALNLLGLSTQVTNNYEYYSSGQYKTYEVGKITIKFMHRSSKELLNLSYKSSLVVQAIKALGTEIDNIMILKIQKQLTVLEKRALLEEASGVTKWIYEIIKRICTQEDR